jgi:hypothetical protein
VLVLLVEGIAKGAMMRRQDALELNLEAAPQAARSRVQAWNAALLEALGAARVDLPAAVRALATVHACMYNAWAACDDAARQTVRGMAVRLPRPERGAAGKASAMDQAAWLALSGLFPWRQADFDALLAGPCAAASSDPLSPAGIGRLQAMAALDAWRSGMAPFAPAVMALERQGTAPVREPASSALVVDCCCRARAMAARDGYTEDQQVLLYFVLGHALADAAIAAAGSGVLMQDACAAAASLVLRRFGGAAGSDENCEAAAREVGRKVGALVFERARLYWQGIL